MFCPKCKEEILVTEFTTVCPVCGANIAMDVKVQLAAEECLNNLITDEDRERIESLLIAGKQVEATYVIGNIRGKTEPFVEVNVVRLIERTTTNERLRQYVQEREAEREFKEKFPLLTKCSACSQTISIKAEACPHCGQPTGVHVCPKCQGTNTKVISATSKATSVFLWGPFAASKVVSKFQCKDCGHKF